MGQLEKAEHERRSNKRSGGKSGSNSGRAGRLSAVGSDGDYAPADWGSVDPRWLAAITVGITSLGGAVILGCSRDGGAFNVTLLLDGERKQFWISGTGDVDRELASICEFIEAVRG